MSFDEDEMGAIVESYRAQGFSDDEIADIFRRLADQAALEQEGVTERVPMSDCSAVILNRPLDGGLIKQLRYRWIRWRYRRLKRGIR